MPPVVLELGELEHVHSSQNLKLRTNVTLSLSQMSHSSMFDSADLETLISTGTWIAGGNRLQIRAQFIFDDIEILYCGNASIVEEIGGRIWSQLGLDATYNISGNDAEGSDLLNELVFTLSEQRTSHTTVNAPNSMPSACLEIIDLLFNFSTCRRIRVPFNIQEQSTVLLQETVHTASLHSYDADALGISRGPPQPGQQRPRVDADFHGQERDPAIGSSSTWQVIPRIASQSPPFAISTPNSQGSVSSMPSRSLGRDASYSSSPGPKHATQKVSLEYLVRILDASLRLMICDREVPKREGVILSKDTGFPRLVDISPAVFSPRFLEAVSQRNALLPNIAQTMCGVHRRTRSRSLKQKMERLSKTVPNGTWEHDITRPDDSQSNRAALAAAIQARLWCLMQHKLLDPQAWPRRLFEILSGPQRTCERDIGSHMLDDPLIDQDTETFPNHEDVHSLSESQYTSMEGGYGVGDHTFDEPDGTGGQYWDNDPFTNGNPPVEDDVEGEDLIWPEWKTVSDDRSEKWGLFYGQTDTLKADDDMDENLFWGDRDIQVPHQDTREDMIDDILSAGRDSIHYSQASFEGPAQCEPTKHWEEHREEMLDDEQDILSGYQTCPEDLVQCESCEEVHEMMLNEGNNVLEDGFAHCLAQEEDHQELLDAREEVRDKGRTFPEHSVLYAPRQMDHEEILDDVQTGLRGKQASLEGVFPYMPWEHGHQELMDETEIILDSQTAPVRGAGFAEDILGHDGDEMLDGERMIFDADQWNEALLVV